MPLRRLSLAISSLLIRSLVCQAGLLIILPECASAQHSVSLYWTVSVSPNVIGYRVYRGTTSGGPYALLNSSPVVGTTFTDSAVQASRVYYYVATAVDVNSHESAYSSEAQAVIPADDTVQVIAAPSTLLFSYDTPGNLPGGQNVLIHSTGQAVALGNPMVTTQSCGKSWLLQPSLSRNTTDALLVVQVAPTGLSAGVCTGSITIPYGSTRPRMSPSRS